METKTQETTTAIAKDEGPKTLKGLLGDDRVKARFQEILGKKAPAFISSVISAWQANGALKDADPQSILSAAVVAASLDLPINGSLGQAAIVPYKGQAQFQIMSRGFVQLAQRSGQYETMNATEVYEGQIVSQDSFTGDMEFRKEKTSDKIVGYLFFFRLVNGFKKYTYMTVEEIQAHGKKFSKSYENAAGMWKKDFHAMALKTVVKKGLSKWGPLSTEMQKAVNFDQSVVTEGKDGQPEANYVDATTVKEGEGEAAQTLPPPQRASEVKKEEAAPNKVALAPESFTVKKGAKGGTIIGADKTEYVFSDTGNIAIAEAALKGKKGIEVSFEITFGEDAMTGKSVRLID